MAEIDVRMPDGSLQPMSYPDEWSQDQVKSAIQKHFPNPKNKVQDASFSSQNLKPSDEEIAASSKDMGKRIGEAASAMFAPELKIPGVESFLTSQLPRAGKYLSSALSQALPQGMIAASQNPEHRVGAGLTAATISGAFPFVAPAISKLLPSTQLNPAQLEEALRVTKGTRTNLGDVLQNGGLKKHYENVVSQIPFSGAPDTMQKTAQGIKEQGENILSRLQSADPTEDIGGHLQSALKKSAKEVQEQKRIKFGELNQAAETEGVQAKNKIFQNTAKEALAEIYEDPRLAELTDASTKNLLKKYAFSNPGREYSLKTTDILRGKLGKKAYDAKINGNSELASIYGKLKEAAESDVNLAIDSSGKEHLKKLRDDAMNFYRNEVVPFEQPEITKFTKEGADPDTLMSSFIKNTKLGDRGRLLEKLTEKITPEQRNTLAHSYFSNAITDDVLDPLKFRTLHKKLGDSQKEAFFGHDPKLMKDLEDYSSLIKKNTEPLTQMVNPKTGGRLTTIPWITSMIGALATGSPTGALAGLAIPAYGRIANKTLTSPAIREKLINKMIENANKQSVSKPSYDQHPSLFVQALMQAAREKHPPKDEEKK